MFIFALIFASFYVLRCLIFFRRKSVSNLCSFKDLFNNLVIFLRIESQYGKDVNVFIDERYSSSVGNCLQFQLLPTIRLPFVPTKSVWKNISLSTVVYLYTGDKKYIILFRAI